MESTTLKPVEIIVVAVSRNGVIGQDGKTPWYSAEELRLFRTITLGGTVIMGRKTYLSIGHPLEGRQNIVVSTTLRGREGIMVVPSFERAVAVALAGSAPVYYCGGAQIYDCALQRADAIYLSRMDGDADGDVFFPELDPLLWQLEREERFPGFVHVHYRRQRGEML